MKTKNKFRFISLFMALLMIVILVIPTRSTAAAQLPVKLGTTSTFAILAGSTITNTGTTTVSGSVGANLGLYPGTDFPGQTSVVVNGGTINLANAIAQQAKTDLVIAYNDADTRTLVTTIPSELGGTTLTPGTYESASGSFEITGTLTLNANGDPNGVFIFKTASTLKTLANSNIVLENSAKFNQIVWKVGSSATLGTNSHFEGHILAMASITLNNGASVQGQLLTQIGAVTLESNTIINGISEVPVITPYPTNTPIIIPPSIPIATPIVTPIATPTVTPIATPTVTPIATPTVTPTVTPIATPIVTPTPTSLPEEAYPENDIPKTGVFPSEILFSMGALITGSSVYFIKKKK